MIAVMVMMRIERIDLDNFSRSNFFLYKFCVFAFTKSQSALQPEKPPPTDRGHTFPVHIHPFRSQIPKLCCLVVTRSIAWLSYHSISGVFGWFVNKAVRKGVVNR